MHTIPVTGNDVVYRCYGDDINTGILACGYMRKDEHKSQIDFKIGYYSCFLLLDGSGSYRDAVHGELPLRPGSVVQRLPGTPHSTKVFPDGQWLEFFISFGKPVFAYMRDLGLLRHDPPVFCVQNSEALLPGFDRFLNRMKRTDHLLHPQLLPEAQKLLLSLHHGSPVQNHSVHRDAVAKACAILGSPAGRLLSLQQVAQQVGLGYDTFRKAFAKTTGKSPAVYRMDACMQQACMMLHSGLPIKEIAAELGYNDVYAFTKQFTKSLGTSPGRYRQAGGL